MTTKNVVLFAAFSLAVLFSASCSKDDVAAPDNTNTFKADTFEIDTLNVGYVIPKSGRDFDMDSTNHYILFNLSTGEVVSTEDSATTKWDIGFYGPYVFNNEDIILNSGIHGPGSVEGQIVNEAFDSIAVAPADGYEKDEETGNVFGNFANYQMNTHLIIPQSNQTYLIHTNDGLYVKLKLENLYQGNPDTADLDYTTSVLGYYTFKYVIQRDGSRNFVKK